MVKSMSDLPMVPPEEIIQVAAAPHQNIYFSNNSPATIDTKETLLLNQTMVKSMSEVPMVPPEEIIKVAIVKAAAAMVKQAKVKPAKLMPLHTIFSKISSFSLVYLPTSHTFSTELQSLCD